MLKDNIKAIFVIFIVILAFFGGKFQQKYADQSARLTEVGKSLDNLNNQFDKISKLNDSLNNLTDNLNKEKVKDAKDIEIAITGLGSLIDGLYKDNRSEGELQASQSTCRVERSQISGLRRELHKSLEQYGNEARRANELTHDYNRCIATLDAYERAAKQVNK